MSLQPFEHYEAIGTADANSRWNARMKWFVVGFALAGIAIGYAVGKNIGYPVFGAFAGGAVGYGIFRWFLYDAASDSADDLYQADWCQVRGMTSRGDDYFPNNAPYAKSGDRRKATDAFEGTWQGMDTLFYNFTYIDRRTDSNGTHETRYNFKIMRLTGPVLPIQRLSIHQRGAFDLKLFDSLQGKFSGMKPISLESAEFNDKFDLTISDEADEIWIRRIFDPATIAGLVDGSFRIPDVKYYDRAWWFVEKDHFRIRDLEEWVGKQAAAAGAADHLSRVQDL
ncbi:MAG: hypothetical protein QM648_10060 [Solirubrobacterales bacterium]